MAVASKKQSRTAGKGVKSPKRKTAKKSRTKTKSRRGNLRLVKKPGQKKSRRSKKQDAVLVIEVVRHLNSGRNGLLRIRFSGWETETRDGRVWVPKSPQIALGMVVDGDWLNLNDLDPTDELYVALCAKGLISDMKAEWNEDYESIKGDYDDYEADDDDEDADDEDEDDDDYDD